MNNQTTSSLSDINDKLLAGKAALENTEAETLILDLQVEFGRAVTDKHFSIKAETDMWVNILEGLFSSGFADLFMEKIEKDSFFAFGEYLASLPAESDPKIISIIHNYLNLFRYSAFLQKIYNERRWDNLTLALIIQSSYTFDILFEQRVKQYKKKNLFRVISDRKTIDYNWQKTSDIVSAYGSSIKHLFYELQSENKFAAFLLENSPDMVFLDLACLTSGIVNVMIPANSVPEHISFILNQTKAPFLLVNDEKQLSKIRSIKHQIPDLKIAVMLKGNATEDWVINFEEFKSYGIR